MRPVFDSPDALHCAVSFTIEQLEQRCLLAAAAAGLLDPVLVPKFVSAMPNALDPSFVFQPVSGNNYDIGVYPIPQDLGLGLDSSGNTILTNLYGYGTSATTATYPGRSFVVSTDSPINVNWRNELWAAPGTPISLEDYVVRTFNSKGDNVSAVDFSLFDHANMPELGIPIVTHLHGGHNEADSDGTPGQWYTPPEQNGAPVETGPDYVKQLFHYANDQQAATTWYHDHAMGVTRLAAYAGMAGFYIIRDAFDTGTASNAWGLPYGAYEIPIAIQDKMFTESGELFYPTIRAENDDTGDVIDPSTMPEMFGDTIVVNGKAWPFLDVEPRKYRFRLVNGADSRFFNFFIPKPGNNPVLNVETDATDAELAMNKNVPIIQIGTDGGILNVPVTLDKLVLAPGQRADIVIDFAEFAGKTLTVQNNAKTPFPSGSVVDPNTTGQIMQFRVGLVVTTPDNPIPTTLRGGPGQPAPIIPLSPTIDPTTGEAKIRKLGLFEVEDEFDRVTPMLGTVGTSEDGPKKFMDPVTERIFLDDTEIWEIYNTTADSHPIHLHLVNFQVIERQKFHAMLDEETGGVVPGSIRFRGKAFAPAANERGWLDTVIINPGEVARIIAKFDKLGEYVWHCHILAHEEHDMMRPFEVIQPPDRVIASDMLALAYRVGNDVFRDDVVVDEFEPVALLDELR